MKLPLRFCAVLCLVVFIAGCTTNSSTSSGVAPSITSANSATFTAGSAGTFTVTTTGSPTPTLTESGALPSGVTFTAATGVLSGTPGVAAAGTYPITFAASNGGSQSATQSFTLTVNAISVAVSPQVFAVAAGATQQFTATTNDATGVTWSATPGTIDQSGNYTSPSQTLGTTATVTATSNLDGTKVGSATVHVVAPGTVLPTANAQVALYTINAGAAANVFVNFGTDLNYGLKTWTQPTPVAGGPTSIFVAGMKASPATYHLQGVVQFADGAVFEDADQIFRPGALSSSLQLPPITTTTTPGMTPQSGVEVLDMVDNPAAPATSPVVVTDLSGNVIWAYQNAPPGTPFPLIPNTIKLLHNGHFLINYSYSGNDGQESVLQEVDLTGALVWQMTAADLNTALANANGNGTCTGCNIAITGTHHDFVELPNGHLIVIAALNQVVGTTTAVGDAIIDLDQNHHSVWVWNEFDPTAGLGAYINRHPMGWPDWTHTNAVLYSPDDGNLLVSIRHQNWVVKIDYENGNGDGHVIWKLGYQGDFTLTSPATDPTDWFYAQHGPSFVTPNTTGKFTLALFDNGNDRVFPDGGLCGTTGEPACYSTAPVLQVDETAKTATLAFNPVAQYYSVFGGNNAVLSNGNVEYCLSAGQQPGGSADIYEVTENPLQTVWHMMITGRFSYRGQRIPSMYPGVQW